MTEDEKKKVFEETVEKLHKAKIPVMLSVIISRRSMRGASYMYYKKPNDGFMLLFGLFTKLAEYGGRSITDTAKDFYLAVKQMEQRHKFASQDMAEAMREFMGVKS